MRGKGQRLRLRKKTQYWTKAVEEIGICSNWHGYNTVGGLYKPQLRYTKLGTSQNLELQCFKNSHSDHLHAIATGLLSSVMTHYMSHRARSSQRPDWAQTRTLTHSLTRWFSRHSTRLWTKACPHNTVFQQTTTSLSACRERGQTEREREKETALLQFERDK